MQFKDKTLQPTSRTIVAGLVALLFVLSIVVFSAQLFCPANPSTGLALRGSSAGVVFLKEDVDAFISGAVDQLRPAPQGSAGGLDLQGVSAQVNSQLAKLEDEVIALRSERYAQECKTSKTGVTSMGAWCAMKPKGLVAESLASWLVEKYLTGKTVGDFGAGSGFYSRFFKDSGKVTRVDAFDGAVGIEEASEGLIRYRDLSVPIRVSEKVPVYDYVVSIEVGEHIPKDREQTFIDNITKHAREGVVLSWAVPGQGGKGHVNLQSNDYIIGELERRGFVYQRAASLEARALDLRSTPWLANTLMVFLRK